MSILDQASGILSSPPGSVFYHLLLLLAVEAALAMAWGEWRRTRHRQAQRVLVAMIGLTVVRVAYVLGALAGILGWVDPWILVPPLERFADVASLALLGWAFVPSGKRDTRTWELLFGFNLVVAVIVCVVFTILWGQTYLAAGSSINYNVELQATIWDVWQIGLIVLATVAVVRGRGMGWAIFTLAMLFLLAGRFLHLFVPLPTIHFAGWERLSNLVAYALIAVAVYQDIVLGLRVQSRELQDISQASLDQIKSLLFLFEASQQMSSSLNLSVVLENAVEGIARALGADQCAIAFPEESDPGVMRLVAIHNPARQGRGEGVTFPLEYQHMVQQALRRKKYFIGEETDNVQLKVLFALLGSSEVGPLLIQPLLAEGEVIGAIIVGNSRSRVPFTPNEAKLCQSMAEQVVGAIQNARLYRDAQDKIAEANRLLAAERRAAASVEAELGELREGLKKQRQAAEELHQREEAAREARNALEIRLVSSRAEADAMSGRLSVLETDLAQAHANAEAQIRWHREELARLQAEWEEANQVADWLQTVVQGMTVGVIVADADGMIVDANVAAEILLERDSGELEQLGLGAICADERWQQAVQTARDGEAVRLTTQFGDNTLMCDIAPLPDLEADQLHLRGMIVVLQDISTEAGAQRGRLEAISAMAEEMRTPMTTMVNYVDLILSGAVGTLDEAQRKFLLRVKAGIERMGQMTDDLAREASGEEKWTSPRRQKVDLGRFIERTVASDCVHLEDRSLTLDLDLPDRLPVVSADPDYLRRVLKSLLANACLASPEGGQVRVYAIQTNGLPPGHKGLDLNGDGFVIVSVKDWGGGLSDEALSRVFDRTRPSRTPPGLGESGAGLALVKTLVEAHGGRLWVESEQGVGTTFSFVLPVDEREGVSDTGESGASSNGTAAE